MTGIYMIISPNAKIYVGQSIDILKRWKGYKKCSCKEQPKLFNSLHKYGYMNHSFEIIEECSEEKLNERERHWQDVYEVLGVYGLNLKLTKTDDRSGKHSDETRKKMSNSLKGRISPNKGKKMSDKQKNKLSEAKKGVKRSLEARKKISESHKGKPSGMKGKIVSDETRKKLSSSTTLYWKNKIINKQ